ncbi:MAG: ABC transporter ATP-binding protein [Methylobacteriaceae bacterium]|nr:ABC transporter ATP-binding protein [Methylobacteriaceae bacterium]
MLSVEKIWTSYETNVPVLKGVSVEVGARDVTAVLGANGAGKSTLLRTISGLLPCRQGRILLDGKDIAALSTHRRVELGVIQVPEGRQMLAPMTVEENVMLGGYARRRDRAGIARSLAEVFEMFPVLKERRGQAAGSLSGGQQQMVAIGRALMGTPRVLLCDEPSFGLAPQIVRDIFNVLASLRDSGIPVLLVEQNAKQALALATRGVLLRNGETVFAGTAAELKDSDVVASAYLGGKRAAAPATSHSTCNAKP